MLTDLKLALYFMCVYFGSCLASSSNPDKSLGQGKVWNPLNVWHGPITEEDERRRREAHSRRKRSPYSDFEFDFTQEEREQFVLIHNGHRSTVSPEGTGVQRVVWDTTLEIQAQVYASYCTYEHGGYYPVDGLYDSVGQNLWIKSGFNVNNKPRPELATNAWWNEVSGYNFDANTCSIDACGHYTQMAWDWTVGIGCGRNYCPDGVFSIPQVPDNQKWIIVCHYRPGGNRAGARPYTIGDPCTGCEDGYNGGCEENLCLEDEMCLGATCGNGGTLNTTTCLCDDCADGSIGAHCQASGCRFGMHNGEGSYPPYVDWLEEDEPDDGTDDEKTPAL